jgi:Predicted CDP-diglyceride synthetase/phosphatidate cytidylyltransferase
MDAAAKERLFGVGHAFASPVTVWITVAVIGALVVASVIIWLLHALGRTSDKLHEELVKRVVSWAVMTPLLLGPVLLGAAWTIGAVAVLSVLCYREFARATGFFRYRSLSIVVVLGIACTTFAIADHWYGLFVAIPPLIIVLLAMVAILPDQPSGYIQRVGIGVIGFLLFGHCLGHLGYIANDADFRPIVMLIILTVELNDVFAYIAGKTFGHRKIVPHTSPNKTLGGALGALILTTALVATVGHFVFAGSAVDTPMKLVGLGLIVSVAGQFGDLMLSSIKRDIGIKDMGASIPGHGGLLDRFDSLLLVAPAVFYYISYFRGFGLDQPTRIFSGGG